MWQDGHRKKCKMLYNSTHLYWTYGRADQISVSYVGVILHSSSFSANMNWSSWCAALSSTGLLAALQTFPLFIFTGLLRLSAFCFPSFPFSVYVLKCDVSKRSEFIKCNVQLFQRYYCSKVRATCCAMMMFWEVSSVRSRYDLLNGRPLIDLLFAFSNDLRQLCHKQEVI